MRISASQPLRSKFFGSLDCSTAFVRAFQNLLSQDERGERAGAIALAIEVDATRLLIDERLSRQAATEQGLKMTGVVGLLLLAKQQGLISVVKPIMNDLVAKAKFRIRSRLYADVLRTANE
jgi:predicted nucleic acid-binding protein